MDLSYMSTLEDVKEVDDETLRRSIGFLSPDTVTQYVFYLRAKVRVLERQLLSSSSAGSQESQELGPPLSAQQLDSPLFVGSVITAWGLYKEGTTKFNINLKNKASNRNHFHLDFRPSSSTVVMNTHNGSHWMQEVRTALPSFVDDKRFKVEIICQKDSFKVCVDGMVLWDDFKYRYSLDDVDEITYEHGSHGNKWTDCSITSSGPKESPSFIRISSADQTGPIKLDVGNVITAWGLYKEGTTKFNINFKNKASNRNHFHLDFRPISDPHGGPVVVMNTHNGSHWMQEVRTALPKFVDDKRFKVEIVCQKDSFKVCVDDIELGSVFKYRFPLQEIDEIVFHPGSSARWCSYHIS